MAWFLCGGFAQAAPTAQDEHSDRSLPQWVEPQFPQVASRITREDAARVALEDNEAVAQAELALRRAQSEALRAQGRNDGVFRSSLEAMRAETPVDSGITRGTNRQDLLQLDTSLSRRFDSGTTLSIEMQNGYTRTVFPLMISGVLQQQIDSGPNYLNALTLSLQQNLLQGRSRKNAQQMDLAAELQVRIAEGQLQETREQVVEQAMNTWSQTFFAEVQLLLQERSAARTEQQIAAADAQLDAGHIAPFERDQILQRLAQNREAVLVAHQELRSSARALMLVLGRAPHKGLVLTDAAEPLQNWRDTDAVERGANSPALFADVLQGEDIEIHTVDLQQLLHEVHRAEDAMRATDAPKDLSPDAQRWCDIAMEFNAEIAVAQAQLRLAESMLLPAEEQRRAQLDLRAGVTSTGLDPDVGRSLKKMASVDALTLFGGLEFTTRLRNRAARAELQAANVDLSSARQQEKHLREQVCYAVADAHETVELQQHRSELSQWRMETAYEGLAAESARFAQGRSTVPLVLDALENVDVSELEHLRVRLDAHAAWWTLQRHVGRVLHAAGLEAP